MLLSKEAVFVLIDILSDFWLRIFHSEDICKLVSSPHPAIGTVHSLLHLSVPIPNIYECFHPPWLKFSLVQMHLLELKS